MTISNKTLTQALVTTPNPLNQITLISMIIKLSIEEHMALTQFLCHPKAVKYRGDLYDTATFDSMEDKVFDALNNLTVEDF